MEALKMFGYPLPEDSFIGLTDFNKQDELKKIHRDLALRFHPDKSQIDQNLIQNLNEAKRLVNFLLNPQQFELLKAQVKGLLELVESLGNRLTPKEVQTRFNIVISQMQKDFNTVLI